MYRLMQQAKTYQDTEYRKYKYKQNPTNKERIQMQGLLLNSICPSVH